MPLSHRARERHVGISLLACRKGYISRHVSITLRYSAPTFTYKS